MNSSKQGCGTYSVFGGLLASIAGVLLLTSYLGFPWMVLNPGEQKTKSTLTSLGLWTVRFGAHDFIPIPKDIITDWLMLVDQTMVLALILSLMTVISICIMLFPCPCHYHVYISAATFVMQLLTAILVFCGCSVFKSECFTEISHSYPNSTYSLSWGYGLTAFSACLNVWASIHLLIGLVRGIFEMLQMSRARNGLDEELARLLGSSVQNAVPANLGDSNYQTIATARQ